jgi:hypothetical protein
MNALQLPDDSGKMVDGTSSNEAIEINYKKKKSSASFDGHHMIPKLSNGHTQVSLVKPSRPLPAYHLFGQLEKAFIMQSGEQKKPSASKNNGAMQLPKRYQGLDIPVDWSASPGKRKKRKHRKSTSNKSSVSFLELSGLISSRWAKLSVLDPETKLFCSRIAEEKLREYQEEMNIYNEAVKERSGSPENNGDKMKLVPPKKSSLSSSYDDKTKLLSPRKSSLAKSISPKRKKYEAATSSCKPSADLNIFKESDLEVAKCLKYFTRLVGVPHSPSREYCERREPRSAIVSPCSSFRSPPSIPSDGTRYGFVDMDDDEIISMFTRREEQIDVITIDDDDVTPVDDNNDAFLSFCQPCSNKEDDSKKASDF